VHVSDRHCKSIDSGALDKVAGLQRVGHGLRRKCIRGDVLVSRHCAEFGLDPGAGAMGEGGRLVRERMLSSKLRCEPSIITEE
jgi:hypothetical protein